MTRMRDPAEIGAVVDRFLAAHPDGGIAEISAWVKSDPDLSSDPDFASDIEEAVRAVLAEAAGTRPVGWHTKSAPSVST